MMRIVEIIVVILILIVLDKGMAALVIAICITKWTVIARMISGHDIPFSSS